jgi:hypothetical protein
MQSAVQSRSHFESEAECSAGVPCRVLIDGDQAHPIRMSEKLSNVAAAIPAMYAEQKHFADDLKKPEIEECNSNQKHYREPKTRP